MGCGAEQPLSRPHGHGNQGIEVKRYDIVKGDTTTAGGLDQGDDGNDLIGASE